MVPSIASIPGTAAGARGSIPLEPPTSALVLFDGSSLEAWTALDEGAPRWRRQGGVLEVVPGAGDICTRRAFGDLQLHLEFWLPSMPEAAGQERANSGVYLQGRYEIQILDSFGLEPTADGCGALYGLLPPLWNACRRPEVWQTLDVAFRAPSLDSIGRVVEPAHLTAFMNGLLIHNNVALRAPTDGALDPYAAQPGPLRLQDHGSRVRFRNIWVVSATRSR